MIMAWARQLAERETIKLTHAHPGLRCEVNATAPSRVQELVRGRRLDAEVAVLALATCTLYLRTL